MAITEAISASVAPYVAWVRKRDASFSVGGTGAGAAAATGFDAADVGALVPVFEVPPPHEASAITSPEANILSFETVFIGVDVESTMATKY